MSRAPVSLFLPSTVPYFVARACCVPCLQCPASSTWGCVVRQCWSFPFPAVALSSLRCGELVTCADMNSWAIPQANCTRSSTLFKAVYEMTAVSQLFPFSDAAAYRNYADGHAEVAMRQYAALAETGRGVALDNTAFLFEKGIGVHQFNLSAYRSFVDEVIETEPQAEAAAADVDAEGEATVDETVEDSASQPSPNADTVSPSFVRVYRNDSTAVLTQRHIMNLYLRAANEVRA